jgi:hypothetical protein
MLVFLLNWQRLACCSEKLKFQFIEFAPHIAAAGFGLAITWFEISVVAAYRAEAVTVCVTDAI